MRSSASDALFSPSHLEKQVKHYTYSLTEIIGKGSSSTVYRGLNILSQQRVAVKAINMETIDSQIKKQLLTDELRIVVILKHVNIVKTFETINMRGKVYIISEYCEGGDLARYIKVQEKLPQTEALKIFHQILLGYKQMRTQGLIHRDLKPANIFLKDNVPKIGDFGFSTRVETVLFDKFNIGTPVYMAPEVLLQNRYSEKSDIWSLGIILYEMIHGFNPFKNLSDQKILDLQFQLKDQLKFDPELDSATKKLIFKLLDIDDGRRLTVDQALTLLLTQRVYISPPQKQQTKFSIQHKKHSTVFGMLSNKQQSFHTNVMNINDNSPLIDDKNSARQITSKKSEMQNSRTHRQLFLSGEKNKPLELMKTEISPKMGNKVQVRNSFAVRKSSQRIDQLRISPNNFVQEGPRSPLDQKLKKKFTIQLSRVFSNEIKAMKTTHREARSKAQIEQL